MKKEGLIDLKTRVCPFCGEEISEEAILCKYCHNLLIDENGKDIEPQTADENEPEIAAESEVFENEDEKTIVYSKEELKKAMEEAAAESINTEEVVETAEENIADKYEDDSADAYADGEEVYIEDYDDETEVYTDEDTEAPAEQPAPLSANNDEYDPKRTFLITAIITLGILIIIIAAVIVGYKLFGFGDDNSSSSSTAPSTTSAAPSTTPTSQDVVTDEYVPQVTDDTVSENPEDIANSEQSDPVIDSAVDSAADSAIDSSADSAADSSASSSTADSAGSDSANSDDSLAGPAGSYYNWDEAMQIWNNYVSANGLTDYGYAYGTDGVEMVFSAEDASGNTAYYRVDLVTGAVSVQ